MEDEVWAAANLLLNQALVEGVTSERIRDGRRVRTYTDRSGGRKVVIMDEQWCKEHQGREV